MPDKLFSIVIPTLNPGPKLEETIKSVLSQDNSLFECIVIDSASTDGTLDLLRKYSEKIVFVSRRDPGLFYAINNGIEMASGEYLYFLSAGDRLRPKILQVVAQQLPQKTPAIVYGNVYLEDEQKEYDGEFDEAKVARKNISQQAMFYHRTIFDLLGTFDVRYRILADHLMTIRCFGDSRIQKVYVPHTIADYEAKCYSLQPDPDYIRDEHQIIRQHLGLRIYVPYRLNNFFYYYPKHIGQKLVTLIRQRRAGRRSAI